MLAFMFCLIVGFLQTVLLSVVLKSALNGNMKNALIALLLKSALYGVGFSVLYFFLLESIVYGGAGFIAGVVCSIIFIAIKSKKDSRNENIKGDDTSGNGKHN